MRSIIAAVLICFALTGCDDGSKDPTPVGTKLPGGFKIDVREDFASMEQCIEFGKKRLSPQEIDPETEILQPTMWVISIRKNSAFQTCMPNPAGRVMFTEASKSD